MQKSIQNDQYMEEKSLKKRIFFVCAEQAIGINTVPGTPYLRNCER